MLKFAPIILAVLMAVGMYRLSAWRTARMLDQRSTPLDDPTIGALTDRMARALDLPKIKVHVYEVDIVNGLAAPDGRVFITRGFLDKMALGKIAPEEIASVIAHELGHVALGHSRKRMIDFAGQNVMRTVLMMVIGRLIPGFGVYIANALVQMLGAKLSRNDEFEADAYAAALMTKAGLGTAAQISLFEKLEAMTGGNAAGTPAWFMSHPRADERIAAIEDLSKKWDSA